MRPSQAKLFITEQMTLARAQSPLVLFYVAALFKVFSEWALAQLRAKTEQLVLRFLACGRLPGHIAFIMDGNRRYARRANLPHHTAGHIRGFDTFERILQWSLQLGIQTVTVYAFSVENFKRPQEEVDMLMELAASKLNQLTNEAAFVTKHQVAIRVIGELEMLPKNVREAACDAMWATRHHTKYILNICIPYTSTAEIMSASDTLLGAVQEGVLQDEDITADHITQLLLQRHHTIPDLLIRTSGERRLSDFLTWQCSQSLYPPPLLLFFDTLWPDFGLWQMLRALLRFQLSWRGAGSRRASVSAMGSCEPARWVQFLERVKDQHWQYISNHRSAPEPVSIVLTPPSSPSLVVVEGEQPNKI